jgi:hypothetical protein
MHVKFLGAIAIKDARHGGAKHDGQRDGGSGEMVSLGGGTGFHGDANDKRQGLKIKADK